MQQFEMQQFEPGSAKPRRRAAAHLLAWAWGVAGLTAGWGATVVDPGPDSVDASLASGGPVTAPWTSYLRAGPGREFAVLDEIEGLTWLRLEGCTAQWCRVSTGARRGFLARADLVLPPSPAAVAPRGAAGRCVPARLTGYLGRGDAVQICGR